jgi:cytochrome c biogenesis protein ResB
MDDLTSFMKSIFIIILTAVYIAVSFVIVYPRIISDDMVANLVMVTLLLIVNIIILIAIVKILLWRSRKKWYKHEQKHKTYRTVETGKYQHTTRTQKPWKQETQRTWGKREATRGNIQYSKRTERKPREYTTSRREE